MYSYRYCERWIWKYSNFLVLCYEEPLYFLHSKLHNNKPSSSPLCTASTSTVSLSKLNFDEVLLLNCVNLFTATARVCAESSSSVIITSCSMTKLPLLENNGTKEMSVPHAQKHSLVSIHLTYIHVLKKLKFETISRAYMFFSWVFKFMDSKQHACNLWIYYFTFEYTHTYTHKYTHKHLFSHKSTGACEI